MRMALAAVAVIREREVMPSTLGSSGQWSPQYTGDWIPVVKLDTRGVLRDVPQHGGEDQEVLRDPSVSELGETVIHEASVQASHKGSYD